MNQELIVALKELEREKGIPFQTILAGLEEALASAYKTYKRGHDPDLKRELALKVLLSKHHDRPEIERRFLEEAQVGGQLQHPGVVPVYELGRFPDARPYFAMKLVQGRTLAETSGPTCSGWGRSCANS